MTPEAETLFIADLHLSPQQPQVVEAFIAFTRERAPRAEALYILGDLFDAWIGDDNDEPPYPDIRNALSTLSDTGTTISIQHGNRDFLLGEAFCRQCGAVLLGEEQVIDLYGHRTLLMHGDTLCTDDSAYQQARIKLRDPGFIAAFLSKSIDERRVIAAEYRKMSGEATSLLAEEIMDVNQQAVVDVMQNHRVDRLIHGHTHRQATHHLEIDGVSAERIVLGEWHAGSGMLLKATPAGLSEERL
ncbi:MAG: UDP-2,3-diacylglucosamine diphosphatase [Pseudomonadota bacterium]